MQQRVDEGEGGMTLAILTVIPLALALLCMVIVMVRR